MAENPSTTNPDIVARLRERTTLRYMADCKCGECQLVHINTVYEAATEIEILRRSLEIARAAIAKAEGRASDPDHNAVNGGQAHG